MKESEIKVIESKIDEIIKSYLCRTVCKRRLTCPTAGHTTDISKGITCGAYVGLFAEMSELFQHEIDI